MNVTEAKQLLERLAEAGCSADEVVISFSHDGDTCPLHEGAHPFDAIPGDDPAAGRAASGRSPAARDQRGDER